jgi:hypothetical protein
MKAAARRRAQTMPRDDFDLFVLLDRYFALERRTYRTRRVTRVAVRLGRTVMLTLDRPEKREQR